MVTLAIITLAKIKLAIFKINLCQLLCFKTMRKLKLGIFMGKFPHLQ